MLRLNASDVKKLNQALEDVEARRKDGAAASTEILLSSGSAKIYHMGKQNPVVRADFKFTPSETKED